jgi:hypothetical protein
MPQINIHVHETHQGNGERAGTFIEPHPKVRALIGDPINWHVLNPKYTSFEVKFAGGTSPFTSGEMSISDTAPRTVANVSGVFHYSVRLVIETTTYRIQDCPELEPVGP